MTYPNTIQGVTHEWNDATPGERAEMDHAFNDWQARRAAYSKMLAVKQYTIKDFRLNAKYDGVASALREDAQMTRARHPHLSAIHDYGMAPARIMSEMASDARQEEAKGAMYVCAIGSAAAYPLLVAIGAIGYAFDKTCLDKFKRSE